MSRKHNCPKNSTSHYKERLRKRDIDRSIMPTLETLRRKQTVDGRQLKKEYITSSGQLYQKPFKFSPRVDRWKFED